MIRPFLKWAGGKYNILPRIKKILPPGKRLIEPFVGSGVVFLNTQFEDYLLADANNDLITLYQHLRDHGTDFIRYSQRYFNKKYNDKNQFYLLRDKFNNTDNLRLKSALFLYLNRHGYNGLCRYNASGKFNVPFGQYLQPAHPDKRMQDFLTKIQQAELMTMDFVTTLSNARKGDVVYCDPPYVPLSKTASFTAYQALSFTEENQIQLAAEAKRLAKKGIPVIISNHDTAFTRKIYKDARIESFPVRRFISRDIANRNQAQELLAIFN